MVVIPTLNEAAALPSLLDALAAQRPPVTPEAVVVSDSGSTDGTAELARAAGCRVVAEPSVTGRGSALRAGVAAAACASEASASGGSTSGGVVWMLHADCLPPPAATASMRRALADPAVAGGAFGQRFNTSGCGRGARHLLRFVVFWNRLRYRLTGTYFGDQGIFARGEALAAAGGVPALDLFEDVELIRRLRRVGRVVLLPERMTTSPRRFLANGPIRQLLRDAWMLARHRLRGDGARYAAGYAHRRG